MLERAVSRRTQGELLSKKQLVQEMIADSWLDLEQFRLLVLRTAWRIDRYQDYKRVRGDISGVKAAMPGVLHRIASRALQVHGSLGITGEMPFMDMIANAYHLGLADGPTEVHKVTLARTLLSQRDTGAGALPHDAHPGRPRSGAGEVRRRAGAGRQWMTSCTRSVPATSSTGPRSRNICATCSTSLRCRCASVSSPAVRPISRISRPSATPRSSCAGHPGGRSPRAPTTWPASTVCSPGSTPRTRGRRARCTSPTTSRSSVHRSSSSSTATAW